MIGGTDDEDRDPDRNIQSRGPLQSWKGPNRYQAVLEEESVTRKTDAVCNNFFFIGTSQTRASCAYAREDFRTKHY